MVTLTDELYFYFLTYEHLTTESTRTFVLAGQDKYVLLVVRVGNLKLALFWEF